MSGGGAILAGSVVALAIQFGHAMSIVAAVGTKFFAFFYLAEAGRVGALFRTLGRVSFSEQHRQPPCAAREGGKAPRRKA